MKIKNKISADTKLSDIIRKEYHNMLKEFMETWRPYLVGVDPSVDVLELSYFEFGGSSFYPGVIYRHLAILINYDAVIPSQAILARYMTGHSNLVAKWESVYREISRYCHQVM